MLLPWEVRQGNSIYFFHEKPSCTTRCGEVSSSRMVSSEFVFLYLMHRNCTDYIHFIPDGKFLKGVGRTFFKKVLPSPHPRKVNAAAVNEERHEIEVRMKDGWTVYRIAKHLGRPYNTIRNEINRGTVSLYNGKQKRYKADEGERVYKENRSNSRRINRSLQVSRFLMFVVSKFQSNEKWSLDACFGAALKSGEFQRDEMVCTKTLYNYVDLGLLPIKNIDLPEKLSRNTKTPKARENKRILGTSIEKRPENVESRTEFGHWEADTVLGKKDEGEPCVLTLVERMTRMCLWVKAKNHTAEAIQSALEQVMAYFGEQKNEVFKTITGDNGSEFADLSLLEDGKLKVYFTHPYSSCEKGTNECHNRMLRRFIQRARAFPTTLRTRYVSLLTASTVCPERFSDTVHRKNCLRPSSTVSTWLDTARRSLFSPLRASPLVSFTGCVLLLIVTFLITIATCYCNLRFFLINFKKIFQKCVTLIYKIRLYK